MKRFCLLMVSLLALSFTPSMAASQRFADRVGSVEIGSSPSTSDEVLMPYIFWGGDFATFYANGGLTTQPGSIYGKLGLKIKLYAGDDTVLQARNYVSGKSPAFRGTYGMAAQAAEVLNQDPKIYGTAEFQMTWSQGDHVVCRSNIRTLADLRNAKIASQEFGPHPELINAMLGDAKLSWSNVTMIWTKDLSLTPDSPMEKFRTDPSISCATVITPDMVALTGGLQNTGSGAEGTTKGAHVLVSTAQRTKTIADLYFFRTDFIRANPEWVAKFTAGYLKAVEEIVDLKKQYETSGSPKYRELLKLAISIYGVKALPNEDEAHGLLSDCTFVGHPGNVAFFTNESSMHGFEHFNKSATDLAVERGYASGRLQFKKSSIDWNSATFVGYLTKTTVTKAERFDTKKVQAEIETFTTEGQIDDKTIYTFTITFQPNQKEFPIEQYGKDFREVVRLADQYGGAVIAIRGHSDPTETLRQLVAAGTAKGVLRRNGSQSTGYTYSFNGKPLDLSSTTELLKLIEQGSFDGAADANPRETMTAALNLSRFRADEVRDAIIGYAGKNGLTLDKSQVQPQGVGIREPFIAKPRNMDEAAQNMRVEFRLLRVSAEVSKPSDFDF